MEPGLGLAESEAPDLVESESAESGTEEAPGKAGKAAAGKAPGREDKPALC